MMSQHDPNEINRLIVRFTDLQERWENEPAGFDWDLLQALAQEGAHAYNEGSGPSFHALALDGTQHQEFHERFLAYSLQAGFDPFMLSRVSSRGEEIAVIDHACMAEAALWNTSSARMRAALMDIARARFEPLAQQMQGGKPDARLLRVIEACCESIPLDLLEQIAPELARRHHEIERQQNVDPIEGYLSFAEKTVDINSKPYG
jgi:hypothetical protein